MIWCIRASSIVHWEAWLAFILPLAVVPCGLFAKSGFFCKFSAWYILTMWARTLGSYISFCLVLPLPTSIADIFLSYCLNGFESLPVWWNEDVAALLWKVALPCANALPWIISSFEKPSDEARWSYESSLPFNLPALIIPRSICVNPAVGPGPCNFFSCLPCTGQHTYEFTLSRLDGCSCY